MESYYKSAKYLGIDLGGTKIEYGVLEIPGKGPITKPFQLLEKRETPKTQKEIIGVLLEIITTSDIENVGLAVAGLVGKKNSEKRYPKKVIFSPNLPFKNFPLEEKIESYTGKKITIENDANCFALAQYFIEKPKKHELLVGITLGTGIGGGIINRDGIFEGSGTAGEIGHMCIMPDGPSCHCGGKGCLEALASGWALEREGEKIAGEKISAEEMARRARKGKKKYLQIFKEMGYYLGIGLANIKNIISPDIIVIGGSLINAKDLFWKEMKNSLKVHSFPGLPLKLKVKAARENQALVALGAALTAIFADNQYQCLNERYYD